MSDQFPALKEAQAKLDAARKELADVFAEMGPSRDMSLVKSLNGSSADKVDWIRNKNTEIDALKGKLDACSALEKAAVEADIHNAARESGSESGNKGSGAAPTKGDLFRQIFGAARDSKKSGSVKSLSSIETKTLFQTSEGWTPEVTRSGLVTLKPMVPAPSVTDHLVTIPVSQTGYKYMEETTYTNNAAEVNEGSTYGEAALELTERDQAVQKVAVWIPVTDEQLEDEPGAEAYIQARLTNMVKQRMDRQVLQGDGNAPNLLGTQNRAGINTGTQSGDDSQLDALYKAFTTIRTVGFAEPSVVFMQAADWEATVLLKTADGIYIYGRPESGAPSTAWGVPVVVTQAAVSGHAIIGDYANFAFLGIKRGLDIQVTNSHDTFFINGKQAIRADLRAVMVHIRPSAFYDLTLADS